MEEQTLGLTQVLAVNLTQPFNKERAGHLMCAESSEELLNVLNHNMQKEINDSNVDFSPGLLVYYQVWSHSPSVS